MQLLKKILLLFVQGLLFPLIVIILSESWKSSPENSNLSYINQLVNYITNHWQVILSFFLIWIVIIIIWNRIKSVQSINDISRIPMAYSSANDNIKLGYFIHSGVYWLVEYPRPWDDSFSMGNADPDEFEIDHRPFCPKCKTELEENKRFLYGYRWSCANCNFNITSKMKSYIMKERIEKIFRSRFNHRTAKIIQI